MVVSNNTTGLPVMSAPPSVPTTQHPVNQMPVRHQPTRKNAARTTPHRYHAPCTQVESEKPMQVRMHFKRDGFFVSVFDQENRTAMRIVSVNKYGRACVNRVINSGMATISAIKAASHASGRRIHSKGIKRIHSKRLTTEKLIKASSFKPTF